MDEYMVVEDDGHVSYPTGFSTPPLSSFSFRANCCGLTGAASGIIGSLLLKRCGGRLVRSMDVIQFISDSLAQVQYRLMETCDGLSQEQVLWRPVPGTNNIGFILWHVSRSQDNTASALAGGAPPIWETDGWYEKFGQPIDSPDPGDKIGLQSLSIPSLEVLTGYCTAAHNRTMKLLGELDPARLDQPIDPANPQRKLANSLRHAITHKNNHHGQIDYIRGLQDQTWDLPPGTGVILPETSAQPASD